MRILREILALTKKDFALQLRSKNRLILLFVFSLLVILVFGFAFGPIFPQEKEEQSKLVASVLWATLLFTGIINLNQSFQFEYSHGAIHNIRLTGIDPSNVYLSKVLSSSMILSCLEFLLVPLTLQFLGMLDTVKFLTLSKILLVAIGGTFGFCSIGVTLSSMSTSYNGGESLLSVILLPLVFPLVMGGSKCTISLLMSDTISEAFWLTLLVVHSLVFFSCSYLLFEFIVES